MKHIKLFESFSEVPVIVKGEKVTVELRYLQGQPESIVEAHNDAWEHDGTLIFSFKFGGDMMMLAKYDKDNNKWYSN